MSNVAKALLALDGSPDYRVLKRFKPRHAYGIVDEPKVGLYVDCETTGLNVDEDKIIQFAAARFEFDSDGNIGNIGPTYCGLEDPGAPLTPEIVELTGITDQQLRGQKIDDAKVADLLSGCVLVIAHNAEYDRKLTEDRFKGFDRVAWACSQRDVPWQRFGLRMARLDYLLMQTCNEFYDGHTALADCLAGIELLATPRHEGRSPFAMLLESAREQTVRVWAWNSPFDSKDRLRIRRYSWNAQAKCWWKDVKAPEVDAEKAWLLEHVYGNSIERAAAAKSSKISAYDRYSRRAA